MCWSNADRFRSAKYPELSWPICKSAHHNGSPRIVAARHGVEFEAVSVPTRNTQMGAKQKIRHFPALVTQPDEFTGVADRPLTIPGTLTHSAMPSHRRAQAWGNKFGHLRQRNIGEEVGLSRSTKSGTIDCESRLLKRCECHSTTIMGTFPNRAGGP